MEKTMMPALPEKGVVFLGGHCNMTKKLRQRYPQWRFLSDDQLQKGRTINSKIVFHWTKHSSHKLMRYVCSKLPDGAEIHYVTATNLTMLEQEMWDSYQLIQCRKNTAA